MRRAWLLDTSVLLHDPAALFRFGGDDLYLPLAVLRALDAARIGSSEDARNALQAERFLDRLLAGAGPAELERGLPLGEGLGRLHFLTAATHRAGSDAVLEAAEALARTRPDVRLTLVARDINLRIQATVLGLHAEDHESERRLDDPDLLPDGIHRVPELPARSDAGWWLSPAEGIAPNDFLVDADGLAARVAEVTGGAARLQPVPDTTPTGESVWGIHARNREQALALDLLMDPEIDFVTLIGPAGTGKTLLALAAGLAQTLETQRYREILMTRATVAIGEEIGYLPGTEEEKMTPWMGALMDNLEVLGEPGGGSRWGQAATRDVLQSRIRVRSLNFMRGRTLLDRYVVLDEAQNLTAQQMRTLVTRAGPGTKVICLGNIGQIDTPYLTLTTSGLTYVVRRFRQWPHAGHLALTRGERSRLADFASQAL